MENANPVNDFITGVGALCETANFMMNTLIIKNFTREEAFELVKVFIAEAFKSASGK